MVRSLVLGTIAFGLSSTAASDPLIEKMRAASNDGPRYAYETSFTLAGEMATGRVDPSQPEGQRIEIFSPDETDWSKQFRQELEKADAETEGDIWCNEFAEMVPDAPDLQASDSETSTYVFTPVPEAGADRNEQKMMKQLVGTVVVDKTDGAVLAFQMVLPKPYKPAMVAKINAFEMDVSCARAPDGRTFIERFNFDISGSAMMQSFDESVSRRITKLLDPVD
ncbi:MAG: hypothetical protein NXH72_08325 [Hyphomonadaceae bacterium]|nr:hypothetical protein [Hyphomonadaceae bacterium]